MNKLSEKEKQEIEHFWAVWRLHPNMKPMVVSYWGDGRYFTFGDSSPYTEERLLILKPVEPF
jgi:hypothetical protein